jgi:superfamily II RNA helicase
LEFDFPLDLFQLEAIKALNTGDSILVVASTSAGKSAIPYHAVALHSAIYTAPVKSLANQKFIELCCRFPDVGLATGDVSTNTFAPCVVMTAEVLRNHLFARSPQMDTVVYVILDEAHYLGDPHRGSIWDEILVASPDSVRFVLLLATLPN